MIPDEAVEAAIEALLASKLGDHAGINGEEFVEAAHLALEAAAPFIAAEAWGEGHSAGVLDAATKRRMTPNPHESIA